MLCREEHRKRVVKSGKACAFFETLDGNKARGSKPTRSNSQSKKKPVYEEPPDDDDEDIYDEPKPKPKRSTSSRATSVPAKTPGSRKSSRSDASGKASGTRGGSVAPAASETEEEVEASGSETGKRVSKSKRKGTTKARERIESIQEEEESEEGERAATTAPETDVQPVVQKPKRGRPPGKSKSATKSKKTPVEDSNIDPAPAPKKSSHARTRSKLDTDDERIPIPSSSKSAPSQVKQRVPSTSKQKATPIVEVLLDPPPPATGKSSHRKAAHVTSEQLEDDEHMEPPPKPAAKGKSVAVPKSKTKGRAVDIASSEEEMEYTVPVRDEPPMLIGKAHLAAARKAMKGATPTAQVDKSQGKSRKSSSTSDDAGYATAEHQMDVDEDDREPAPPPKPAPPPPRSSAPKVQTARVDTEQTARKASRSTPVVDGDVKMADRPRTSVSKDTAPRSIDLTSLRKSMQPPPRQQARISSRPTVLVARPPSRIGSEIVDISSDEDVHDDELDTLPVAPAAKVNGKAPNSGTKLNGKLKTPATNATSLEPPVRQSSKPPNKAPSPAAMTVDVSSDEDSPRKRAAVAAKTHHSSAMQKPKLARAAVASEDVEMEDEAPEFRDQTREKPSKALPSSKEVPQEAPAPSALERSTATPPPPTSSSPPPNNTVLAPPSTAAAATPAPPVPLPSFDDEFADDSGASSHKLAPELASFTPFLSMVPMHNLTSLSEEESNMTLEQYIRREIERQYQQLKEDGERKISLFKEQAEAARKRIEES